MSPSSDDRLNEIAKLLAVLISRDRSLQDAVGDLDAVGFGPKRIAELLGTTPGYVNVAAARIRKSRAKQKKANTDSPTD